MEISSLYITQTAVIGLSDVPLEVKDNIRSAFHTIFKNENCFDDALDSVSDDGECDMPFISNMGQLRFNEQSMDFFIDNQSNEGRAFGYDTQFADQRMNFLCFWLHRPFKMLAQYGGKVVASGKIFLHVYPTGYIVVHLAVYKRYAKNIEIKTEEDILDLINETKPWMDGKWKWKSRFGCFSLRETFEQIFQNISLSLLTEGKLSIGKPEWKAGVIMRTDLLDEKVSKAIMEDKKNDCFVDFKLYRDNKIPKGSLIVKKRIYYYFADYRIGRAMILHSFWKINYICEFVLYKSRVYSDYLKYIQKDRNEMRNLMLNKDTRFKIANMVGKDFYKASFFEYTQALDEFVKILGAKYRSTYTIFSNVEGFNDKRTKLNQALEKWENDIKVWNSEDIGIKKLISFLLRVKGVL